MSGRDGAYGNLREDQPLSADQRHAQRASLDPSRTCTPLRLYVLLGVAVLVIIAVVIPVLLLRGNATPSLGGTQVNVTSNVVLFGGGVWANWQVDPSYDPDNDDALGLFAFGAAADAQPLVAVRTESARSGNLSLTPPPTNGVPTNYEVRYVSGSADPPYVASTGVLTIGCLATAPAPVSNIAHVVLIVQENHSFDNFFGTYCTAPAGSNPSCNTGPACCEAAPATDPSGAPPVNLTDAENGTHDPDHQQACELAEQNGGAMDRFTSGAFCSSPRNFALSDWWTPGTAIYRRLAQKYALADRYHQPIAGATSSNDMFLVRGYEFTDNDAFPWRAVGGACNTGPDRNFKAPNIGDMYRACGISFSAYAEGYDAMRDAERAGSACPTTWPADCPANTPHYPCTWDSSDVGWQYYESLRDRPEHIRDFDAQFQADITAQRLPAVAYVKALGYKTEHPGAGTTITAGATFVQKVHDIVMASSYYANNTLVIWTYDEGGGYFDHIPPPPPNPVDGQPYGVRIPTMAMGVFAKQNYISHVPMEHGSILRFLQWNWFNATGQLQTRDTTANHISDLLDPVRAGRLPA